MQQLQRHQLLPVQIEEVCYAVSPNGSVQQLLSALRLRVQVEVFCYAASPNDGSEWRQRIEAEAEHFLDVSAWSVGDIAARISAERIHVAINLNGYTKACAVTGRHGCAQRGSNMAVCLG